MNEDISFLREVAIFSQLTDEELGSLLGLLRAVDAGEGQRLFREGDEGDELYIVKSGCVASRIRLQSGSEREIARFLPGDFFGEMCIFERAPRSATCSAVSDSELYSLHESDFYGMMNVRPRTAIKIMHRMLNITTQRLQNTSEFLSDMVHWGEEASRRVVTDELTGAYNRRFLDDALPRHFESARSTGNPLSIIMLDLDYFRQINEHYGQEMGDKVILSVVSVLRECMRQKDIIARYGGDEFTLLLPETDMESAWRIGERVRQGVESLPLLADLNGPVRAVTTSQGLASYPECASDLDALRDMADKALYRAKEEGRNRVVRAH